MFQITLSATSWSGLIDALAEAHAMASASPEPKTTARAEPKEDAPPARTRAAKAKVKDEPVDEPGDEDFYADTVRPAINKLSEDYGRETVLDVLSDFTNPVNDKPCASAKEVDPADYRALVKAIKAKARELGPVD